MSFKPNSPLRNFTIGLIIALAIAAMYYTHIPGMVD